MVYGEEGKRFTVRLKSILNPKLPKNRRILRDYLIGKRARRYFVETSLVVDRVYIQGLQHGLFLAEKSK